MNEMLKIVTCRDCKQPEYYGMTYWLSGHTVCRECIYEIWKKQSNYKWEPSETDYVFPLYEDGLDHRKQSN